MNRFQRFYLKGYCYFVTSSTRENIPIFEKANNAEILLKCLYNFRSQGRYLLIAFVIMSTHFHVLLVPDDKYNISQIMHSIKRSSSRLLTIIEKIKGSIWLPSFYEHVIRNKKDFLEKIRYIYNNPVKARLAKKPENYRFSSANPIYETDLNKYFVG